MKKGILLVVLLLVLSLGAFVLVFAADPPDPVCGDGIVNLAWEECDDANHDVDDACDTYGEAPFPDSSGDPPGYCQYTRCGDGIKQTPNGESVEEKCDTNGWGYCPEDPTTQCDDDSDCDAVCVIPCTNECGTKLLGWAWSYNFGWLSLNKDNCDHLSPDILDPVDPITDICEDYLDGQNYYVQVDTANNLKGYAWSENVGWVCFGSTCNPSLEATVQDDGSQTPPITGWGKIILLGDEDEGKVSLNCENDGNGCAISYGLKLGSEFYPPHGNEDNKVLRRTLFGWAWNDSDQISGLGWIKFSPTIEAITAWLETRQGDIYAKEGTELQRPIGAFNATYRILAQGNIEALSSSGIDQWVDPQYGPINFPTPQTRYSNILGKLDVDGLICTDWGADDECTNKYGKQVVDISSKPLASIPGGILGGKIYYYEGDLTIDSSLTFNNSDNFENGAGTIIIDGDLTIEANIFYNADPPERFKNLGSVAWIVRGDVTVQTASNLAGAFIVLGDKDPAKCPKQPVLPAGCGYFNSGAEPQPLTVSGLIMARQFNLERTGGTVDQGSEVVIYDGRLLANIPPGLENFAQALPIWRSRTFSQ